MSHKFFDFLLVVLPVLSLPLNPIAHERQKGQKFVWNICDDYAWIG